MGRSLYMGWWNGHSPFPTKTRIREIIIINYYLAFGGIAITITITEYQALHRGTDDGLETLSPRHFDTLESFVLSNHHVMRLSQEGNRRVLKAQNYVGLIQLDDGFQVEILPKVFACDIPTTKKVLLQMLKSTSNITFHRLNLSNVDTTHGTILDVFIETFLAEVENIIKNGIYANYRNTSSNEKYLNGKLLVSKNLRENYAHKERFYIKYDTYTTDCSENRLLKSALALLERVSHSATTSTSININSTIRNLLRYFDGVELSRNYELDFANCSENRNNRHYQNALNVARVFLKRETFTNYSGNGIAYALLFPMETVFERYVANLIKSKYPQYTVTPQDTTTHLLGEDFLLRPDIVVRDSLSVKWVMDTKWKVLDGTRPHYGIDIKDMYQAYAYAKRFNCSDVVLIYPKPNPTIKGTTYTGDGINVTIKFFDLKDVLL